MGLRGPEREALCRQKRTDCNRYIPETGGCAALQDTNFNKPCPFYRKKTETGEKSEKGDD